MSLLPIIFRDMERPLRMLEQQMRMAEECFPYMMGDWKKVAGGNHNERENVVHDKDMFQIKLDVQHFSPEEIVVKIVNEKSIVVDAKHESNDEKGSVSRLLVRQFNLPEGHDLTKVETKLSRNGILTITAPNKSRPAVQERVIPFVINLRLVNASEMSLLPIIFRDMERPLRMLEQQMRMAEEMYPYMNQNSHSHHRHGMDGLFKHESVTQDKEKFQVKLDVKHFTPEEISVKVVDDHSLVIEAKHESKDEKGSTSRHLIRQFVLPDNHDLKKIETKLSSDGVLTIVAPNKEQPAIQDHVIPVTHVASKK
ncbi:hypothetical protein FQR65_LT15466 [Abscondita terminalis]|nr:hypothetical protein FQR65_LT15466 [Abscondita terminalis]